MYCWSCNYPLTGLSSTRCPECGRVFDPANPATMNLGQPMGRLARWLLAPVSLATLALALVGCILVLIVTRLPLAPLNTWFLDFRYYLRKPDLTRLTWRDTAYMLGLLFSAIALTAWLLGTLARQLAQRKYQPPKSQRTRTPIRHLLLFLLLTVTTIATGGAWPYRYGQIWVAERLRFPPSVTILPPLGLPNEAEPDVLFNAFHNSATAKERIASLRILIDRHEFPAATVRLLDAAEVEKDVSMLTIELRLLGISGRPDAAKLLQEKTGDPNVDVRLAAVDALGSMHGALRSRPNSSVLAQMSTDPPLIFRHPPNSWTEPEMSANAPDFLLPMPPATQSRLRDLMLTDPDPAVRQAAARALVPYPPEKYKLRVAEWGVWSAEGGNLKPVAPVTADLPPFVHPTGDPIASMDPRINCFYAIRKPVLHITASAPMSLDLQVLINQGRPWFAYPMPDDYAVQADRGRGGKGLTPLGAQLQKNPRPLATLDFPTTFPTRAAALAHQPTTLPSPHTGYPWLLPAHPQTSGDAITQMGLRWQSIIISPEKLPWMTEPAVPDNKKYNWWKRLRNTSCSWLSSRNESERFLYYDGPTNLQFPIDARIEGNQLVILPPRPLPPGRDIPWSPQHDALTIQVADGLVDMRHYAIHRRVDLTRTPLQPVPAPRAIEIFQQLLIDRDLNKEEAAALSDCWQSEFFQTPGQRLLIFLSREDYDHFCPITIRPKPTQLSRVGIIWMEMK